MSEASRPLSPHLQIYRWQVSNTLSILHRFTGVALSVGALALVAWLLALASGQLAFQQLIGAFQTLPGQVALVGWTYCFFFHFCNGIRHLAWDADYGFDKHVARRSGLVVVAISIALTLVFWVVVLGGRSA